VATACGLATLREIARAGLLRGAVGAHALARRTACTAVAAAAGVPFAGDCEGGMFGFFFHPSLPQNYGTVMSTDQARFNRFFHGMLDRGVYLAPGAVRGRLRQRARTPAPTSRPRCRLPPRRWRSLHEPGQRRARPGDAAAAATSRDPTQTHAHTCGTSHAPAHPRHLRHLHGRPRRHRRARRATASPAATPTSTRR
jgi:hypothetical protein